MSLAKLDEATWAKSKHVIDTVTDSWIGYHVGAANANTAWVGSNIAIYVPVRVPERTTVVEMAYNGNTVSGYNIDIGIYNSAGVRLVSLGSTAATTGYTVVNVTDTTIGPGMYYLALNCDNGGATFYSTPYAAPSPAGLGLVTESVGSVTLPATATWAVNQTLAQIPYIAAISITEL